MLLFELLACLYFLVCLLLFFEYIHMVIYLILYKVTRIFENTHTHTYIYSIYIVVVPKRLNQVNAECALMETEITICDGAILWT